MTTSDLQMMLATTSARSSSRCCFLLHVRPEKLPEYVAAHQDVWEEMRGALTAAGWRNYSLFLRPQDGMVVGYFEADDVDAAQEAIARADIAPRWEAAMAEYFVSADDVGGGGGAGGGGEKQVLPQYFYLP